MLNFIFIGSLNLLFAVVLGAFGAHGLKARLSVEQLGWWQTGVQYHSWHALGLIAIGLLLLQAPTAAARPAGWALQLGIVLFSGSLYAMALGAPRWFGAITPLGGTAFIVGWGLLAWAAWKLGQ
ncbi:DUF423 domain-containing protein [Chitinolyticbacter albus]|uniref:DUF423 domain-containing protein n=1 Tax=Chitinolyticbacter albus TaxID=2961951 RepID=UPI002108F00F|nr:DUF423 domain-containing protein [Chitinolyticbacter albus]